MAKKKARAKTVRPVSASGASVPASPAGIAFPVLVVGSSPGELKAFTELLSILPGNTGIAFILIRNREIHHSRSLAAALSKTTLSVIEASDGVAVQPDFVYLGAPDYEMTIRSGVLRLASRSGSLPSSHKLTKALAALTGTASAIVDSDLQAQHFLGNVRPYLKSAAGKLGLPLLKQVRPEFAVAVRASLSEACEIGSHVHHTVHYTHGGRSLTAELDVRQLNRRTSGKRHLLVVFRTPEPLAAQVPDQERIQLKKQSAPRDPNPNVLTDELTNLPLGDDTPVLVLDAGLRVSRFTPPAGRLFKLTPADVGRAFKDIASPLDIGDWDQIFAEARASGRLLEREVRDGEGHRHSLRVRASRTPGHVLDRMLLVVVDSGYRDEAILHSLVAHVAVIGPDGAIVQTNDAWDRFARENGNLLPATIGRHANYLSACRSAAVQGVPEAQAALEGIQAVLDGDVDPFKMEYSCHSATAQRWFLMNVTRLKGNDGGAVISHWDITDRKQAELAAQKSESTVRALLEASAQSVVAVSAGQTIMLANGNTEKMFGYVYDELIGQPLDLLVPEISKVRHRELHTGYLTSQERRPMAFGLEVLGRRRDGSSFPAEISLSGIDTPEGPLGVAFVSDISDRKQMEQTLQAQRDRLDKIVATAPGVLCSFRLAPDGSTSFPFGSLRLQQLVPEIPDLRTDARPLFALMHPEDARRVQASIAESARTLGPWQDEYRILTPTRGTRWIEARSVPERRPDGSIEWHGSALDVTERKELEQSLLQSRQEIRSLLDNSPDAIARFDLNVRFLYANARILNATGLSEREFTGKRLDEVGFPRQVAEIWADRIRRVIETGQSQEWEFSYPSPLSETIWAARFIPEFGPGRAVHSVLAIASNITERRRTEIALQETNARLGEREAIISALFDTASQAILGVRADGMIQLVNQMAEQVFGYERRELLGQTLEILLPERFQEHHRHHRRAYMGAPESRPMGVGLELLARRKDGTEFPVEVSLSYIETNHGPLAVSFITDITLRQLAQLTLRANERELHDLAGRLLTAQEDERRRIARDLHDDTMQELAHLSMEIGRLVWDRTPLAETRQRLRLLQQKVVQISNDVRQVSHQLHPAIIGDLGLSAGLKMLFVDFTQLHGIPVEFTVAEDPTGLSIESASCLYRIAQECLQNVSKHARATAVHATLKRAGEQTELTIRDNGIGLPGTDWETEGLGLISMKERVRAANGTIAISSRPGYGTQIQASVPPRAAIDHS